MSAVDPKADMWRMPAMYVGNYAERDAELTLGLWKVMQKEIIDQDLDSIFHLETDLFPCLVDMRFLGVRVDVQKAHELKQQLASEEDTLLLKVKKETGVDTQIWAARSIAKGCDKLNLPYERTAKKPYYDPNPDAPQSNYPDPVLVEKFKRFMLATGGRVGYNMGGLTEGIMGSSGVPQGMQVDGRNGAFIPCAVVCKGS